MKNISGLKISIKMLRNLNKDYQKNYITQY